MNKLYRMMESMKGQMLATAATAPEIRDVVIGLAQDAADRNVI